jgi:UDP-2,3-diacylglucosamine hydrolase
MPTLFISDLHLDAERPATVDALFEFLRGPARNADGVYILGDLFESWVGDDTDDPLADQVARELRAVSDSGVALYFVRGNRDFLLSHAYAERAGLRLLPDPCVIEVAGEPWLLLHGDLLCTDDVAYQAFRRQVRDPAWQTPFLTQPLEARKAVARKARAASAEHQRTAAHYIVDANADAVESMFRLYGVDRMIHGHTHRPALHRYQVDGRDCERHVLADWHETAEVFTVG